MRDRARVDGRLVDHHVAALERAADRLGRSQQSVQVRPLGGIDRRRHGDDVEIGARQIGRVAGVGEARLGEIGRFDLAGAVAAGAQLVDAAAIDVEADHPRADARERDRHRQTDIAEADDGDVTIMSQPTKSFPCARVFRA
jgi:hypothetical protein